MAKQLHAIMLPFPAQGHINPMFQLAMRLLDRSFYVTFINTKYDHERILANGRSRDLTALPDLRFVVIPDGLPPEHGRLNDNIIEFAEAMDELREPLGRLIEEIVGSACVPVTCIIADCFFHWMPDVAEKVGVPGVALWTTPAHSNVTYCSMSDLMLQGIIPVNRASKRLVTSIPGVPPLHASDLPSFLQTADYYFHWCLKRFGHGVQRAHWNLGNSIYHLEKEAVHAFRQCVVNFLPIGPLLPPSFFAGQMAGAPDVGTSLWPEDSGCKEWMDKQEARSVLYISFGSIVHMSPKQVEEVALGVEASGQPFLWVLRSDVDAATHSKLRAFQERTQDRGLVVSWAPQLLILSHPSVAAFLTHCGWNSLLEGMSAGLPILAWPGGFAEQKMNARYVVDVWKIGMEFQSEEMEDGEVMIRKEEVVRVIDSLMNGHTAVEKLETPAVLEIRKSAEEAFLPGGSSHDNLNHFIEALTADLSQTS